VSYSSSDLGKEKRSINRLDIVKRNRSSSLLAEDQVLDKRERMMKDS